MAVYEWVAGQVPDGMKITQVYCVMFDRQGRVMLRLEKAPDRVRYSLAGGRPEPFDHGIEETCRRELLEEVNTEIEKPVCIGYQRVDEENGTPPYVQVRMAAMIRSVGEKRPDPDNGETYDRRMVPPEKAAELLRWGDVGRAQIMAAKDVIYRQYGITAAGSAEEWI